MSIIRSTHFTRLSMLAGENSKLSSRLSKASEVAATGLSYSKPSDDPGKVGVIHSVREQVADQEVWKDNAEWAENILVLADESLSGMTDVMATVKELATQMSSDHYEAWGMTDAVEQATSALESMLAYANTNLAGRHVFAGASYDSQAFDATGVYQGDTIEPEIPVGDDNSVLGGFDGSRVLQGTTDVFQVVNDFIAALGSGDSANVVDLLDDIDDAQDQLISAQAEVGAEMLKVEDAVELASSLSTNLSQTLSRLTEADQVESYAELMKLQTAYEAALQVTAASNVGNLFNKI